MTIEKKSVINAHDLTGVAAKLNRRLNRSAKIVPFSSELALSAAKPSARAIARKYGIRRELVEILEGKRIGIYTYRLLTQKDGSIHSRLSVQSIPSFDKGSAALSLASKVLSSKSAVLKVQLLRYEPLNVEEYLRIGGLTSSQIFILEINQILVNAA